MDGRMLSSGRRTGRGAFRDCTSSGAAVTPAAAPRRFFSRRESPPISWLQTGARDFAVWILAASYVVLWVGGIASRIAAFAAPAWAAPVFLVLAAAIAALGSGQIA